MPASQYGPAPEDHDGYPSAGDHRRLARTGGLPPAVATYKKPGQPPWASRPLPPRPNHHIVFNDRRDNGWNTGPGPSNGPSRHSNGSPSQNHYRPPAHHNPPRPARPVAPASAARPPQAVAQPQNKQTIAGPSRQPDPVNERKRPAVHKPWKTEKKSKKKHPSTAAPTTTEGSRHSAQLTEEEIEEIEFNSIPPSSRATTVEPEYEDRKPNLAELDTIDETPCTEPEERTEGTYWVKKAMIPAECYHPDATRKANARNKFRRMKEVEFEDMGRDTSRAKWRDDGFALDWRRKPVTASTPKAQVRPRIASPSKARVKPSPASHSTAASTIQDDTSTPPRTTTLPIREADAQSQPAPSRQSPAPIVNTPEVAQAPPKIKQDTSPAKVNPDLVELFRGSLEALDQALETRFNELTKWTRLSVDRPHHSTVISHHIEKTKGEIFAIDEEIQQRRSTTI